MPQVQRGGRSLSIRGSRPPPLKLNSESESARSRTTDSAGADADADAGDGSAVAALVVEKTEDVNGSSSLSSPSPPPSTISSPLPAEAIHYMNMRTRAPRPPPSPLGRVKSHPSPGGDQTRASVNTERRSVSYHLRAEAPAYYDSRAGTHSEFRRRGRTLQEYYDDNPHLLPQLPFTWYHGRKRWRLFLFAFLVFVDASVIPIALYYALRYAGNVEGWIIFAVVTTIWGGPTYLEFAIRTWRLIKKERFYRPLGTNSRWCFDMLTWASVLTITAVTALFIVGSAPHIVWLRVLCMPAPAILYSLGGVMALITLFNVMGWKAPFRISSTSKGQPVLPAVYYFIEDVAAVNAGAGRPFREALAARYEASPRFRRMLYVQSIFWSIPSIALAIGLTVVAVYEEVPATVAYGICWAVPFVWCAVWAFITIKWCKRDMVRERLEWEADYGGREKQPPPSGEAGALVLSNGGRASRAGTV